MPKPMKLMVEVEELAFGRVFRTLDNMPGVATLTIVSEGMKLPGSKEVQKRGGATTVSCIILGELVKGTKNNADLRATLKKFGKAETSLPDALTKLVRAKEILRKGSGSSTSYTVTLKGRERFKTACQIQQVKE